MKCQFTWPDRRPIGILHIASVDQRTPENPYGFLFFHPKYAAYPTLIEKINAYIDECLGVLWEINAQEMWVQNLEGHRDTDHYLGAPETKTPFTPYAGAFFKRFRDAGLKVGCCIRHDSTTGEQTPNALDKLFRKINFARYESKWGCKIFYFDSNGPHQYAPLPADYFHWLRRAFPDCLFVPEHGGPDYHQWTARYRELRPEGGGFTGTPADIRQACPGAFSVLNVSVEPQILEANEADLVASVKRGDVLAVNSWWSNATTRLVGEIARAG